MYANRTADSKEVTELKLSSDSTFVQVAAVLSYQELVENIRNTEIFSNS